MKQNYEKHDQGSAVYTYTYLANSTNRLIQIFKRLEISCNEATGWIGKEQPFAPIAPPLNGGSND